MVLLQQQGGGGARIAVVAEGPGCVLLCGCGCGWLLSICGAIQRLRGAMRGVRLWYSLWTAAARVEIAGAHLP
eukprot:2316333-Prorocentrum_lima.AAC.1